MKKFILDIDINIADRNFKFQLDNIKSIDLLDNKYIIKVNIDDLASCIVDKYTKLDDIKLICNYLIDNSERIINKYNYKQVNLRSDIFIEVEDDSSLKFV